MRTLPAAALRRRLLLWTALVPPLFAVGLGVAVGLPLLKGQQRTEQTLLAAAVRATARNVDAWLHRRCAAVRRVAEDPDIRRALRRAAPANVGHPPVGTMLDGLAGHDADLAGAVLVLNARDPFAVARRGEDIPRHLWPSDVTGEDAERDTSPVAGDPVISGPVFLNGKECLLFSAPIFAPSAGPDAGKTFRAGTAVLAYPTLTLRALLPETPGVVLALDTASGRFLLRSVNTGPLSPDPLRALDGGRGPVVAGGALRAAESLQETPGGLAWSAPAPLAAVLASRLPELAAWSVGLYALCLGTALLLSRPLRGRLLVSRLDMEKATARNAAALADLRKARQRAEEADGRRARLAGELIRLLETIRRTLARELHDQAGQMLTTLLLRLDALRRNLERGDLSPTRGAAVLEALSDDVRRIQVEIRKMAKGLRPPVLDALGLVPAVEALADEYRRSGVDVHVFQDALPELSEDPTLTLYRIVQESLTNAVRHGGATAVHITLTGRKRNVSLSVEDNGRGFDTTAGADGLGLTLMRERAARLGGTVHVESRPGQGTTVLADLPTPDA